MFTTKLELAAVAVAVTLLGAGGIGVATAATPTAAPAAAPGVHCTYTINDPNGADVHDFPAHASNFYGSTRPYGATVTSRRGCGNPPLPNGNVVKNDYDGGSLWVQVIVGNPGDNINGWVGYGQVGVGSSS